MTTEQQARVATHIVIDQTSHSQPPMTHVSPKIDSIANRAWELFVTTARLKIAAHVALVPSPKI